MIPRLSASEAVDNDDEFDNFASSTGFAQDKRSSRLGQSSLAQGYTRSLGHAPTQTQTLSPEYGVGRTEVSNTPNRIDSIASSGASSFHQRDDGLFMKTLNTQFEHTSSQPSRTGSPTQLQQYSRHETANESEDEVLEIDTGRRLFIANADIDSDSD